MPEAHMKRFFDERLIAVAVAAAFALGTFNPDFALARDHQKQSTWLSAWMLEDAQPDALPPKPLPRRHERSAHEIAAR